MSRWKDLDDSEDIPEYVLSIFNPFGTVDLILDPTWDKAEEKLEHMLIVSGIISAATISAYALSGGGYVLTPVGNTGTFVWAQRASSFSGAVPGWRAAIGTRHLMAQTAWDLAKDAAPHVGRAATWAVRNVVPTLLLYSGLYYAFDAYHDAFGSILPGNPVDYGQSESVSQYPGQRW